MVFELALVLIIGSKSSSSSFSFIVEGALSRFKVTLLFLGGLFTFMLEYEPQLNFETTLCLSCCVLELLDLSCFIIIEGFLNISRLDLVLLRRKFLGRLSVLLSSLFFFDCALVRREGLLVFQLFLPLSARRFPRDYDFYEFLRLVLIQLGEGSFQFCWLLKSPSLNFCLVLRVHYISTFGSSLLFRLLVVASLLFRVAMVCVTDQALFL